MVILTSFLAEYFNFLFRCTKLLSTDLKNKLTKEHAWSQGNENV